MLIKDSDVERYELTNTLNKVIWGDALVVLHKFPPECVDMVFIDPPYFMQIPNKELPRWGSNKKVSRRTESWDEFSSFVEYDSFMESLLRAVQRVMKPSATIWVIGTYHNIHRVGALMQNLGFWLLNDVIWLKNNPMPNWLRVRFTNATETLIWAVKDKNARYTFHHEVACRFALQPNSLALNVWRLPICSGSERLRDAQGNTLHPTQKPEALLERVILVSTNEGDVVLDPMAGTGTTGVVAARHKRHFILIEKERKYAEACAARIQSLYAHTPFAYNLFSDDTQQNT